MPLNPQVRPSTALHPEAKHAEILAQVDACLPKDAAGNFIADQEKSDVVHDLLAFLAERMRGMNKKQRRSRFLGWLEGFWAQVRTSRQDEAAELLRFRFRRVPDGAEEEP